MSIALWVVQALLALMFVTAGIKKSTGTAEKLSEELPWTQDFSRNTVRFIGVTQLLAALGLVLPGITGIATWLTPLAATGLVITMLLAMNVHRRRGESSAIVFNLVLAALAAFVAWGRFGPYAF